jgi:hypothetical protein
VPTLGGARDDVEEDEDGSAMTSDMMVGDAGGVQAAPPAPPPPAAVDLLGGLMDDEPAQPTASAPPAGGGGGLMDLFGGPVAPTTPAPSSLKVTLPADRGEGMQVRSAFAKEGGRVVMQITIENNTMGPLSGFAIQFNKNSFGLVPENPASIGACLPQSIASGASGSGSMPLLTSGPLSDSKGAVQMAIKTNVKVNYFQVARPPALRGRTTTRTPRTHHHPHARGLPHTARARRAGARGLHVAQADPRFVSLVLSL